MRVIYEPDKEQWDLHFQNQIGGSTYYQGVPFRRGIQNGAGLGSILAGFSRYLIPIAKSLGKEAGHHGLLLGSRVLGDLAQGKPLNIPNELTATVHNFANSAKKVLQNGEGRKRRRKPTQSLIGKSLRPEAIPAPPKDPFH